MPANQTTNYLPGDIVDNAYQLTKLLGTGGMGVVFACNHLVLQKAYALKILMADQLESDAWNRFKVEAKALAKLNHPGIVGIYNMGIDQGRCPYYVMDLLSGESLDLVLKKNGPLPTSQALELFAQVAVALGSAHSHGIIHRDVKPSNLMLVRNDQDQIDCLKIVDFGIARLSSKGGHPQSQTATGVVFGTPFYMSPEQCRGERVDERSDIYSFGCTLFEVLTGDPPFVGKNAFDSIMMHMNEPAPSLSSVREDVEFPEALEELIQKTLSKDLADRYQSMGQLKHDLERIKQGKDVMRKGKGMRSTTAEFGSSSTGQQVTTPFSGNFRHRTTSGSQSFNLSLEESEEIVENKKSSASLKIALASILAFSLLTASYFSYQHFLTTKRPVTEKRQKIAVTPTAKNKTSENEGVVSQITAGVGSAIVKRTELLKAGATEREINAAFHYEWLDHSQFNELYKTTFADYMRATSSKGATFTRGVGKPTFYFPTSFYLCALKIGDGQPFSASGVIPVAPGQDICLYLFEPTDDYPQLLDRFGPDDFTGIEIKIREPRKAIQRLVKWHRLKDLCFFNSLVKSLPNLEAKFDESSINDSDLPFLKPLKLQTLGLCGPKVNGAAILKMPMLSQLESLKVKRINGVQTLIKALPKYGNIKEVWLLSQGTTDADLEPLTRMKNLQSLRIRRSQLTPASVRYFKKMPALKHLYLDRPWGDEEKTEFKKAIPYCQFETVLNRQFWRFFPTQTKASMNDLKDE